MKLAIGLLLAGMVFTLFMVVWMALYGPLWAVLLLGGAFLVECYVMSTVFE